VVKRRVGKRKTWTHVICSWARGYKN
jgi:hypothetical protein